MVRVVRTSMTLRMVHLAGAVVALALVGHVSAEPTPPRAREAQRLIKQLGAAEFQDREAATQKLMEMGVDIIPVLERSLEQTQNAEVKTRCKLMLRALREKRDFGMLTVSLDVADQPLSEVVRELARQSGNTPMEIDPAMKDLKVTVKVKNVFYWKALEAVCESTGTYLVMKPSLEHAGQGIFLAVRTDRIIEMGTIAGPGVVKVSRLERRRQRHLNLRGARNISDVSQLNINMQVILVLLQGLRNLGERLPRPS